MGRRLSLLKNLIRHPLLFKTLLSNLKSTQLLMNAAVADYFRDQFHEIFKQNKLQDIEEMAQTQKYVNKELFLELLDIMEANNYIKIINNGFQVLELVPNDIIKRAELKAAKEVRESFISFIPTVLKALDDRLRGVPLSEFDAGELRVQWEIALKGDFYTIQRDRAFKFASFPEFIKGREAPIRLLDYGCGSGESTKQLYNYFKNSCDIEFTVDGCDISIGLLEIAEDDTGVEYPLEFFSLNDSRPKSNYYDAIFLSQVIHWDKNCYDLIKELKGCLKPGGMLFGVESNFSKRIYQVDLFLRLLGAQGFPPKDLMFDWFEKNGLKLEYDEVFFSFKAIKPN